ncbi:MAG: TolC family protein [Nitrospiria bacterium]
MTAKEIGRFTLLVGVMFFLQLRGGPAFAARSVTIEEAYRLALEKSEFILIAGEDVKLAEDEKLRARSALFPSIKADLSYQRRVDAKSSGNFVLRSEEDEDFQVTLTQQLFSGGRASANLRKSNLGIRGEIFNLRLAKEDLLFNIAKAYYEALKAENNVRIEEKEVRRLELHRRNSAKRVQVGEATNLVLLQAETELSGAKAKRIRVKNTLEEAKDRVALLAKIEGSFDLVVPAMIPLQDHVEAVWLRSAKENRYDLKQSAIDINAADEDIAVAKGSFFPTLSLEASYRFTDQDPKGSFLIQDDFWAIAKLSIPVFDGMLRDAELAQARSRSLQRKLSRKRLEDEVSVEVRRSLLNLVTLTREVLHLKEQVRFARETFSLASRQFEVGLGTSLEVLDANATLLDAERQLSNTRFDRELAILQLKKSSGLFLSAIE